MNHVGISKTIIKTAAELGGDRPFLVTIFVCIAIALLYTTVSGLGAVIMAATIALPILISVGVPKIMAGCIFLFSYAIGLAINLANWTYFTSVTGIDYATVQTFSFILLGLTALTTLVFVICLLYTSHQRTGDGKKISNDIQKRNNEIVRRGF